MYNVKNTILAVAPHPDDETLGCGGSLLRFGREGAVLHWLIVTRMTAEAGYSPGQIAEREGQIAAVAAAYGFESVHQLAFPAAGLDRVPDSLLVERAAEVVRSLQPDTLFVPFPGDVHSDHGAVFNALSACGKWFRQPSIRRVLAYEALSETNFQMRPDTRPFQANCHVDISATLEEKLRILALYRSETGDHPFPRGARAVRALAELRGSEAGFQAAEAFMSIRERIFEPRA